MKSILSYCPKCSSPICQRLFTLNLSLGEEDNHLCFNCLAKLYDKNKLDFFEETFHYIQSRECFFKAWHKLKSENECPNQLDCIFERCFVKT
jgi:hypothetical protein